jgi:hypothetical protein
MAKIKCIKKTPQYACAFVRAKEKSENTNKDKQEKDILGQFASPNWNILYPK